MSDTETNIKQQIEKLLRFGLNSGMLEKPDVIPTRNALLDLLGVTEPYEGVLEEEQPESLTVLLESILDYAAEQGMLKENNTTYRDLLDARIMGLMMPRQSEVAARFWQTAEQQSIRQATDEYYALSQNSNYIRMDRIRKNEYWQTATAYGDLEITINLSKPEKDPKEIAAERAAPQSHYPSCLLCIDNVGYAGRLNHPARQNHRVVPLELNGRPWFLQYSPYVYYNEHCIVFSQEHTPMIVGADTFTRLLDFITRFPHYFIGSNADLPIVGGSILNHDHFQGGKHRFAMEKANVEQTFLHADYPGVQAGIVHWPMSVIRILGTRPRELADCATLILSEWRTFSDASVEILAASEHSGQLVPHNTITAIARMNAQRHYELDLVLRNNRVSAEHPEGIFHPHEDLHHVKKENIGLIEVMGLAVLPGRLKLELEQIKRLLTGLEGGSTWRSDQDHALFKHRAWIEQLMEKYGTHLTWEEASRYMHEELGCKFLRVLVDAGVYKRDSKGLEAFHSFMKHIGFQPVRA